MMEELAIKQKVQNCVLPQEGANRAWRTTGREAFPCRVAREKSGVYNLSGSGLLVYLWFSYLIPDRDVRRCILYERKRTLTRKVTWKSRKYNRVMGQGRAGHKLARDDKSIWVKLLSNASEKGRLAT